MPRAGFSSARSGRSKIVWRALLGGLILSGAGCQRHYYYYYGENNAPNCPPGTASSVQQGPVCEVPGQVIEGGTVVSSAADDPPIAGRARRRVVVSESTGGSGSGSGKSSWKASDPDSAVATQVDGAIDNTVRK